MGIRKMCHGHKKDENDENKNKIIFLIQTQNIKTEKKIIKG